MRSEYKGHVIETVAEPEGTRWRAELTVRRHPSPESEPEVHRENLPDEFATAEQAERAALDKGERYVDGLGESDRFADETFKMG
jgi:hypothetical protein